MNLVTCWIIECYGDPYEADHFSIDGDKYYGYSVDYLGDMEGRKKRMTESFYSTNKEKAYEQAKEFMEKDYIEK